MTTLQEFYLPRCPDEVTPREAEPLTTQQGEVSTEARALAPDTALSRRLLPPLGRCFSK